MFVVTTSLTVPLSSFMFWGQKFRVLSRVGVATRHNRCVHAFQRYVELYYVVSHSFCWELWSPMGYIREGGVQEKPPSKPLRCENNYVSSSQWPPLLLAPLSRVRIPLRAPSLPILRPCLLSPPFPFRIAVSGYPIRFKAREGAKCWSLSTVCTTLGRRLYQNSRVHD